MVNYIRRIFNYLKPTKYMNMTRENQNRQKQDCKERKTIGQLKNQTGRILLIMNDFYVIENKDNQTYQRVGAGNLPEEFKKDGLMIIYSGELKEIYPQRMF